MTYIQKLYSRKKNLNLDLGLHIESRCYTLLHYYYMNCTYNKHNHVSLRNANTPRVMS